MSIIKKSRIVEKGVVDLMERGIVSKPQKEKYERPAAVEDIGDETQEAASSESIVESAYEKASQIIAQAQAEAQEITENVHREIEEIKENARVEGYDEGKREGEEKVAENISEAIEVLNSAVKERKKIIQDSEGELVRLSQKIAEQIVRSEISLHKDVVMNIIAEAVNRVSDRENVVIKVNRDDIEYVKQYKDRIAGMMDGIKNLTIVEDSQTDPGGCIVETNLGFVDARISTKLSLIEKALKKVSSSESE